ncbi:MAG: precorrin-6y C5,15-methyltransferase (decarboxylating) subunit CbiE [Candidatus Omnitrophica bacterium]|nr:precorrin-6y C5,15-methyltransferase (decarboxylating) subunit CbiE [Candidatus Omnitrophota bacterium]
MQTKKKKISNGVYIIGTGPGNLKFLSPVSKNIIKSCDIVIASSRLMAFIPKGKKIIRLEGKYKECLEFIQKNALTKKIAVLVSGDPGIFSFSKKVTQILDSSQYEIVPGVSSLQVACARVGLSWDDLSLVSVHGKSLRGLAMKCEANKKVIIFCDNKNTPARIAKYLTRKIKEKAHAVAFGNLSLPDEEIIKSNIISLAKCKKEWKGLWLLLLTK